jgi:hypothetical protein
VELDNGGDNSETLEQWNVSATPIVPRLILPLRRSKTKIEKAFVMVNIIEKRRKTGIKKK